MMIVEEIIFVVDNTQYKLKIKEKGAFDVMLDGDLIISGTVINKVEYTKRSEEITPVVQYTEILLSLLQVKFLERS